MTRKPKPVQPDVLLIAIAGLAAVGGILVVYNLVRTRPLSVSSRNTPIPDSLSQIDVVNPPRAAAGHVAASAKLVPPSMMPSARGSGAATGVLLEQIQPGSTYSIPPV